jgi:hypothetical protein
MVYGVGCFVALDNDDVQFFTPLPSGHGSLPAILFSVSVPMCPQDCDWRLSCGKSSQLKKFRATGLDSSTKRLQQAMVLEE